MKAFFFWIVVAIVGAAQPSFACENLISIDTKKAGEMMQVLGRNDASEVDRLSYFDQLKCINRPGLRRLALRTALNSTSATLRGEALAAILMEREGVRLELSENAKATNEKARKWISDHGATIWYQFYKRDPARGCINLSSTSEVCYPGAGMRIDGPNVRITDPVLTANLVLTKDRKLFGSVNIRVLQQEIIGQIALLQE